MAAAAVTSVSVAYPALRAKKLTWADHRDSLDQTVDLCSQESLSLSDFARLIHLLLPRCELDTTKTAHHFQIDDTFVDIMYRDHVLISVSKRSAPEVNEEEETADEDTEVTSEDEEEDDDEEEKDEKGDTIQTEAAPVASATVATPPDEEEAEVCLAPPLEDAVDTVLSPDEAKADEQAGGAWTPVVSKRTRQAQSIRANMARLDNKTFYFFANEANVNYMDFVGMVQGLDGLLTEARKYKWSHGYHMENNTVYDFNDASRPGLFRYFIPNTAYLHKFKVWFEDFQAAGDKVPEDTREFYVFRENSVWHKWTALDTITGLRAVRRAVLASGSDYGHAYCLDTNDLVNFWLDDGHFRQSVTKAPVKYIQRFEAYLNATDPNALAQHLNDL